MLELDLGAIVPSLAGPKRPQDRVALPDVWDSFVAAFHEHAVPDPKAAEIGAFVAEGGPSRQDRLPGGDDLSDTTVQTDGMTIRDGSVVIAAITSCTNTSNPSVMLAAGLLAKRAVEAGLDAKPWVKTSLAPGSRVVTDYLDRAGLTPYLEKLGFGLVGYGCTTCIGNSGPLIEEVATAVDDGDLNVAAVLSGNRNFEGRVHPQVRASYLGSPPLVVAYALAGRVDIDLSRDPIATGPDGPVFLRDLWPAPEEVAAVVAAAIGADQFEHQYARIWEGDERWRALDTPEGAVYAWDGASTYVQEPPFFADLEPRRFDDIEGARDPGQGGGLDHDRSHLTGGHDQGGLARRPVPRRTWGRASRLQLLRVAARESPRDDARHVREHPPAQRARTGHRGIVHHAPARWRGHVDLRRVAALRGRRACRSA